MGTSRTARSRVGLVGAAVVLAVALGGCRRERAPAPVTPEPAPSPAVVPDLAPEPPPVAVTSDSWTQLLRLMPRPGFAIGVDVRKLRQNVLFAENFDRALAGVDAKLRDQIERAHTCGVQVREVRRAVLAMDLDGTDAGYFALELPRIGDRATWDCLITLGKDDLAWQGSEIVMDGGKTRIYPQGPDAIVVVSHSWVPRVEEAMASDRAEPDPELGPLLGRVDLGAGAWAVGFLPQNSPGAIGHVRQFAVTIDTTFGVKVAAWLGIDPAHIDTVRSELEQLSTTMMAMLPSLGVPDAVVRSLTFTTVGDGLVMHVRANEAELRTTIDAIKQAVSPTHQP